MVTLPQLARAGASLLFLLAILLHPLPVRAIGDVSYLPADDYSQRWSIAATLRTQVSPYEDESTHSDFIPLLTYSGETLFLAGTKGGIHLFRNDDWRANLYAGYRFAGYNDEDKEALTGMEREDSVDGGIDLTRVTSLGDFTFDATSDISSNHNGQVLSFNWSRRYDHGAWTVLPWVGVSWYSQDYNQYYFGVEAKDALPDRPVYHADESTSLRVGSDVRYNIDGRQFLTFNIEYERLGNTVYDSPITDEQDIFKLGLNYRIQFEEENAERTAPDYDFLNGPGKPWFVRVAGGFGTEVTLNKIVRGDVEYDTTRPGLISVFMGRQLSDTFFGSNWEVWLKGGVARRFERGYQDDFFEYVAAFKFYYNNFPWSDSVLTRFGFAEGISYAEEIPYMEQVNLEEKNPTTSNLLNYLDVSIDASIGDMIDSEDYRHCFFGFSVHHRSGIFASADMFGPVNGGSNVNTLYVECLYQ